MSIVVTPQPFNVPPRVRIDVDSNDSAKPFTALTIMRDGRPVREQPYVGGSTAAAFDYEAPFGMPATYSASGTVATVATLYSTSWPNLSGWTTDSGSPAVAGGRLTSGAVSRDVAMGSEGRLLLTGLFGSAGSASLSLGSFLTVSRLSNIKVTVTFGGVTASLFHESGTLRITWDAQGATVTSDQDSRRIVAGFTTADTLVRASVASGGSVPGFFISGVSNAPFEATATTTLNVAETWLIHPSKPSLSIPIDHGPQGAHSLRFIEASSGESKSSQAQRTIHRPVGRRKAVVITTGPRQADEWTLVLGAPTIVQKDAVRSIVDDQTPLLLRSPADVVSDLPDDWYSVGDVTVQRVEVPVITEETTITLPLTPVDEPIVRQGALWTWGDVLLRYATWRDVLARNDSWLDVLTGEAS